MSTPPSNLLTIQPKTRFLGKGARSWHICSILGHHIRTQTVIYQLCFRLDNMCHRQAELLLVRNLCAYDLHSASSSSCSMMKHCPERSWARYEETWLMYAKNHILRMPTQLCCQALRDWWLLCMCRKRNTQKMTKLCCQAPRKRLRWNTQN